MGCIASPEYLPRRHIFLFLYINFSAIICCIIAIFRYGYSLENRFKVCALYHWTQISLLRDYIISSATTSKMAGFNFHTTPSPHLLSINWICVLMEEPKVYSVVELTNMIKERLRTDDVLANVWVKGEISNLHVHSSGHVYFTLKDEGAVLNCALFKGSRKCVDFDIQDGMNVLVRGSIDVYVQGGRYNLVVREIERTGIGTLYLKFIALKNKLAKEGLFNAEHKKELPRFPGTIGVVTSPTGAALRDIIRVLGWRYPLARVIVAPARVQGKGAADTIIEGIRLLNEIDAVDIIIIGRGGGSLEDLWAFNEERLARAIFASEKPVVTGIGHETDVTIADFVGDVRGATPSAAAELVVPNLAELRDFVAHAGERMVKAIDSGMDDYRQKCDELSSDLSAAIKQLIASKVEMVKGLGRTLEALSPRSTIERGYSVVLKLPGRKVVDRLDKVDIDDELDIIVKDGSIISKVKEKRGD